MKKFLLTTLVLSFMFGLFNASAETIDLNFNVIGTNGWGGYANHTYNYSNKETGNEATIVFTSFSKQSQTIKDYPVTKTGPLIIELKNSKTFKSIKFTLQQWTNKAKTATLQYSSDGKTYNNFNPEITSSVTSGSPNKIFFIEAKSVPEGTKFIKLGLNANSSNQVAVQYIDFEINVSGKKPAGLSFGETTEFKANLGETFTPPLLRILIIWKLHTILQKRQWPLYLPTEKL